jgi:hypothetical protein
MSTELNSPARKKEYNDFQFSRWTEPALQKW